MIIGGGLIASAFTDTIIFASGVSNSSCADENEFRREEKLLMSVLGVGKVVYFSSAGTVDCPYLTHKRKMEKYVLEDGGIVLRLSQVVGQGGNSRNLFNYIVQSLKQKKIVLAKETTRGLVDVCDVVRLVKELLYKDAQGVYYLTGEVLCVEDIVDMVAKRMNVSYDVVWREGMGVQAKANELDSYNSIKQIINKYVQ